MTIDSIESRRVYVNQLLQDCMDQKVLYGGTANAISKAEEAYRLAHLEPRIPSPWPELAAYRLSHLLLRYDSRDVQTLEKIDRLLAEAAKGSRLGPLPSIYRLGVLHRMQSAEREANRHNELQLEIQQSIDEAVEWLRRNQFSEQGIPKESKAFQAAAFNLLELAHYFIGAPYEGLEGLSGLESLDPMRKGAWILVGRDVAGIPMTEEMAQCEFVSRAATSQNVVLISLDTHGAKWGISPNQIADLSEVNPEFAKLTLLSIDAGIRSSEDLRQRVVGGDGNNSQSRFRQVKKRTKEALQKLIGRGNLEVFLENRLSEEISVLGLVHKPALR